MVFLLAFVALLGILVAMLRHLLAKRWARGAASFKLFCVAFLATIFVLVGLVSPMTFRIQTRDGENVPSGRGGGQNAIEHSTVHDQEFHR